MADGRPEKDVGAFPFRRESGIDGATAGHDRKGQSCGWRFSSWKRVALAVLVVMVIVGLATALGIVLSRDTRGQQPKNGSPSVPRRLSPPSLPMLSFNATCSFDDECVSKLCLSSRCSRVGQTADAEECRENRECRSTICDADTKNCRLQAGSVCKYSVYDNFCASNRCSTVGLCM